MIYLACHFFDLRIFREISNSIALEYHYEAKKVLFWKLGKIIFMSEMVFFDQNSKDWTFTTHL